MAKPIRWQRDQLKTLAQTYVPEWRFSEQNPDAGSVVAMLIDDMLAQSEVRFSQVLHKHKIQYLNLFDRLKEEPIESAKSYVRFSQVASVDGPVAVPRGTRLVAEDEKTGAQLIFETTHGITTTPAELVSVCTTDGESDQISRLMDSSVGSSTPYNFFAFGLTEKNEAEHLLFLGYDVAFDELKNLSFGLRISTITPEIPESLDETLELMLSDQLRYSILEPEGEHFFDKVERRDDLIWLSIADYIPQKVELSGAERYVICLRAKTPMELRITSCELVFSEEDLPADEVICSGVSQGVGNFLPFGKPMEIFSECGIENSSILARRGAEIEMSFDLDFEVLEQRLPEPQNEPDYKIIMKRPMEAARVEIVDIKADYVLIEYLSIHGWRRLLPDEHTTLLMNGSATGKINLKFICPDDIASSTEGEYRLRMRLMRADNLYRIPCRQYCPVVRDLRFSYSYVNCRLLPDYACTRNNFSVTDITSALANKREIRLFFSTEAKERAMYLGFDQCPDGMPLSLYFEVENDDDARLEYTVDYLTVRGFEPITLVDNTGGMLYSGTLLLPAGGDAVQRNLFDRNCWWLRLRLGQNQLRSLPLVRGIMTNMARVENLRSHQETFFMTQENAPLHIALAEQNLISVRAFVNEDDGDATREENWVEWSRRVGTDQRGRYYDVDLAAGLIDFDRYAFAAYPLKEGVAAVRVDYQSYQGSAANVPQGAISDLAESVRHISHVTNPMAAYGGYDGYNEKTSMSIIANMLRTRGRAVTGQDYFDIISQVSYGVRRIKCVSGVNRLGKQDDEVITVALLIDEYDKGSHIFSAVKDTIRQKLLETSSMIPLGKTLVLSQPHFVRFSVRIWIDCATLDGVYELQQQTEQDVRDFLDPLRGGFDRTGWEIGVLPTVKQLLAYLKMKRTELSIARVVMSAQTRGQEFAVDDELSTRIDNPFAMAVSGKHTVYVNLTGR